MSFFSIPDPIERERVVEDYKRIKREIQERNENRKMSGQNRNRTLQETFNPVVKAQTDMTEKIVESLKEIRPVKEEKNIEGTYNENYLAIDKDILRQTNVLH